MGAAHRRPVRAVARARREPSPGDPRRSLTGSHCRPPATPARPRGPVPRPPGRTLPAQPEKGEATMATEFTLDEARLADLAARYEIETDHDALLALEAVILGDGDGGPLLDGPCEVHVDLLADADGELDGYRVLLHPEDDPAAPWLASHIQRVSYHQE